MNTEKTHGRFWDAMRARFGIRWFTEFGDKPSAPWVQLLNRFTPDQLKEALELMAAEKLAHPPTLSQFEVILKRAAVKKPEDTTNWVRNYWRSVIVDVLARDFWLAKLIPRMADFEAHLVEHRDTLGQEAHTMLVCVEEMERRTGRRTDGMHEMILHWSFEMALERSPYYQRLLERRRAGETMPRPKVAA